MFQKSLIKSVYPTAPLLQSDNSSAGDSPAGLSDENNPKSRSEAKSLLESTLTERGIFRYSFANYYWTWFLISCCCCFLRRQSIWWQRKQFKYDRYNRAVERLNEDIDILKHLSNQRVSTFIAKLILRKHQRALVHSFRKHLLADNLLQDEKDKQEALKQARMGGSSDQEQFLLQLNPGDSVLGGAEMIDFESDPRLNEMQR